MGSNYRAFCTALFVFSLVLTTSHARFVRLHSHDFHVIEQLPLSPLLRTVNDVAPAVQNATELALTRARTFVAHYANALRIVTIPTGIIVTFLGYFLLNPVLFSAGMLTGGGATFVALRALLGHESPSALWLSVVGSLLCGFIVGLLAIKAISVGMFAVGALLGVVIASALKPSVLGRVYPANHDVGFYLGAVVIGAILGLIAMKFQKPMVILATSYAGAFGFFFGIGYFAGHFPNSAAINAAQQGHFDSWFIAYVVLTGVIGTAGAITQFNLARSKPMPARRRSHQRVDVRSDDEWYEEQQRLAQSDSEEKKKDTIPAVKEVVFESDSPKPRYYGKVNVDEEDSLGSTEINWK